MSNDNAVESHVAQMYSSNESSAYARSSSDELNSSVRRIYLKGSTSSSSCDLYTRNLIKVLNECGYDSNDSISIWLLDKINNVCSYIINISDNKSLSSALNLMNAIIKYLYLDLGFKFGDGSNHAMVYEKYNALVEDMRKRRNEVVMSKKKNPKEIAGWEDWDSIVSRRDKMGRSIDLLFSTSILIDGKWPFDCEKLRKYFTLVSYRNDKRPELAEFNRIRILLSKYIKDIQDHLILCLYTMVPPLRNDYADMLVVRDGESFDLDNTNNNYYHVNDRCFIINKFKTSEQHGRIIIDIDCDLEEVLGRWLQINPNKWLLINVTDGTQISRNNLGKYIKRLMGNVSFPGVSMIRKSYLSSKYDGSIYEKMKEDARIMGHTVATQQTHYVKND
jgi:hypothetical protein